MAEISIEDLIKILSSPELAKSMSEFTKELTSAVMTSNGFADTMTKLGSATDSFNRSLGAQKAGQFKEALLTIGGGALLLKTNLQSLDNAFDAFWQGQNDQAASGVRSITSQFAQLGKIKDAFMGKVMEEAKKSNNPGAIAAVTKLGDKLFGGLETTLKPLIEARQKTQNLEMGFISMMSTSGQLNSVFDEGGTTLADLSSKTAAFAKQTADLATETGLEAQTVAKLEQEFKKVPGALSETAKVATLGGKSINEFSAAAKMAAITGESFSTIISDLAFAYNNLSRASDSQAQKTRTGLEMLALTAQTSATLKIPLDDTKGALHDIASKFALLGDNTEAATVLLGRFVPAMSGVASNTQAIAAIKQMTDGIQNLNLAQKSLLSSQAGGSGGLMGAFKIDRLLKEGKLDEVTKMVESSLKKQFGKIVTLDEASSSQQAAAQMTKQLAFLKGGPFGNLVQSDQQGYQLLEGIRKARPEAGVMSGRTALDTSLKEGDAVQARNRTSFDMLGAKITEMIRMLDTRLAELSKSILGQGKGKFGEVTRTQQQKAQQKAEMSYGQTMRSNETGLSDAMGEVYDTTKETLGGLADSSKDLLDIVAGRFKGVQEAATSQRKTPVQRVPTPAETDAIPAGLDISENISRATQEGVKETAMRAAQLQAKPETVAGKTPSNVQAQHIEVSGKIEAECPHCHSKKFLGEVQAKVRDHHNSATTGPNVSPRP